MFKTINAYFGEELCGTPSMACNRSVCPFARVSTAVHIPSSVINRLSSLPDAVMSYMFTSVHAQQWNNDQGIRFGTVDGTKGLFTTWFVPAFASALKPNAQEAKVLPSQRALATPVSAYSSQPGMIPLASLMASTKRRTCDGGGGTGVGCQFERACIQ